MSEEEGEGLRGRKEDNSSSGVHVAFPNGFRKRQTDGYAEDTCHTILWIPIKLFSSWQHTVFLSLSIYSRAYDRAMDDTYHHNHCVCHMECEIKIDPSKTYSKVILHQNIRRTSIQDGFPIKMVQQHKPPK